MDAWGIKAKQEVERKEPVEMGNSVSVITKKYDIDVWMLIHGMGAGQFTAEFDCDCLIVRNGVLRERMSFAEMALEDKTIKSFEVIKFNLTEVGVDNETWKKLEG